MRKKDKYTILDSKKKLNNYVNTYSLWQKSSPVEISKTNNGGTSAKVEPVPIPELQVVRDSLNRKLIKRDGLFYAPGEVWPLNKNSTSDWLDKFKPKKRNSQQKQPETNRIQKNLTKALAQPVEISKGANMLQKMGWQGGALGKTGMGIVEPIAPDASYAATTKGLGHTNSKPLSRKMIRRAQAKAKDPPQGNKQVFKVNVLNLILDFVKDDSELELVFEDTLMHKERFLIHNIVNGVINVDEDDIDEYWCNNSQMEIVKKIQNSSCFVLGTKSHGEKTKRQLTIFKITPPNVYLVVPMDLQQCKVKKVTAKGNATKMVDVEEGGNNTEGDNTEEAIAKMNTDKTETDNQANDIESVLLDKIIEYFSDFINQDKFTAFRFLGPFDERQLRAIDQFLTNMHVCTNDQGNARHERLLGVIKNKHLEIYEDINGSTVIHKVTECEGDTIT